MKSVADAALPAGTVTWIGPAPAPIGTVAVICVSESTVNVVAGVDPKATAVAPEKPEPVMTTVSPTVPDVGSNEATCRVVTRRRHPPSIEPPPVLGKSSNAYSDHVPFGSVPLKTESVAP